MEGLEPNAYYMAREASTLDQETLEVEVVFNENQSELDLLKMEREFGLEDDSFVAHDPKVQQEVVVEMADARTRTLEIVRGGRGNNMVTSGGASRRTGSEGSVGALTVNPDCPIRKQDEHKKHTVENTILRGKVADNDVQTRLLEAKVQSLKGIGASMADLLGNRPDSHDATSQDFQDKMKKMADLFNNCSSR